MRCADKSFSISVNCCWIATCDSEFSPNLGAQIGCNPLTRSCDAISESSSTGFPQHLWTGPLSPATTLSRVEPDVGWEDRGCCSCQVGPVSKRSDLLFGDGYELQWYGTEVNDGNEL